MTPERKLVLVNSTFEAPNYLHGRSFNMPMPCVVQGIWLPNTGTLLLESVLCDGRTYSVPELNDEEVKKFTDELQQAVISGDF